MDEEKFEKLKLLLRPSPHNMDQELIELPQYIEEIAENVALALRTRDMAANDLKFVIADEADKLRNEGERKPSEKQIESDVLLAKAVRKATEDVEQAKYGLSLWQGLMEAARAKSEALQIYAKLWMAGYLTPNAVYQGSREELAERRRQRPPLKRSSEDSTNG